MRRRRLRPMTEVIFEDSPDSVKLVLRGVAEVLGMAAANPAQTYLATHDYSYRGSKVSLVVTAFGSEKTGGVGLNLRATSVVVRTLLRGVVEYLTAQGHRPHTYGRDEAEWDFPAGFRLGPPLLGFTEPAMQTIDVEMTVLGHIEVWRDLFVGSDPLRNGYRQTHSYWVDDVRGKVMFAVRFEGTGQVLSRDEVDSDPELAVLVGAYNNVSPPRTARVVMSAEVGGMQVLRDIVNGERLVHNLVLYQPVWLEDGTLECLLLIVK